MPPWWPGSSASPPPCPSVARPSAWQTDRLWWWTGRRAPSRSSNSRIPYTFLSQEPLEDALWRAAPEFLILKGSVAERGEQAIDRFEQGTRATTAKPPRGDCGGGNGD